MAENQRPENPVSSQPEVSLSYPKSPIEQTITDRLLGDVARTQSGQTNEKVDVKARFETYGSPAADAVVAFLGKQELSLDEAQNAKENQPVEKKWWSIARKFAANMASFAIGYGLGFVGGPVAAFLGRLGVSAVRSGIEYSQNATLDKAAQFYKHRASSLKNAEGFLEKSRKVLGTGERIGLEKAFQVENRDREIFAQMDTLSGRPGSVKIGEMGIENPNEAFASLKKIAGVDLDTDKPEATTSLKNTSELLKKLYTQSILAGYSQNTSPEKIQAYADMVVLLSTAYNQSLAKHKQSANTNNLESLQDIWKSAQEETTNILKSGLLTYTGFSALGAAVKSGIFALIGAGTRELVDMVRNSGGVAHAMSATVGPESSTFAVHEHASDAIDHTIPASGFHSRAEELLTAGGDKYDNILDVDERAYRLQFLEAVHMAKNPDIGQEHIDLLHNLENKGVTVDEIFRAVDNNKLPADWGVDLNTARSILSAARYESLIEQIASITGKSSEDAIKMLAEGDILTKIDSIARTTGMSQEQLIQSLTLRGDVVGGRDGISILARIMTDSTTAGDINSLQQMASYTGGVSKSWFTLAQETFEEGHNNISEIGLINAANHSGDSVADLLHSGKHIEMIVNENEIYADLQGNQVHDEFMEHFGIFFKEHFGNQDIHEYLNNISADPNGERLERLEFLEAIDLAKDENSARFYLQTLESIAKDHSLSHNQILDLIESGKTPIADWGITQEQVETLPAAIRLSDLVTSMAQNSGHTTSQVIDDLAGARLSRVIEEFATNHSLNPDVVKQIITMQSGFKEGGFTGDNLLIKIYSEKAQEVDVNIFRNPETINALKGISPLWNDMTLNVFNQDGDEMATIQELGFKTVEEYYQAMGIDSLQGTDGENVSELVQSLHSIRNAFAVSMGWGSGLVSSFAGAVMATGNYPNGKYAKSSNSTVSNQPNRAIPTKPEIGNGDFDEKYNLEANSEDHIFSKYIAHLQYRITSESMHKTGRQMDSAKFKNWIKDNKPIEDIKDVPAMTSILSYLQSVANTISSTEAREKMNRMLQSEVGTLELMRYSAALLFIGGDDAGAKRMEEARRLILQKDPTLSDRTRTMISERDSKYSEKLDSVRSMLQQNQNLSDEDRTFLDFFVLIHQIPQDPTPYKNTNRAEFARKFFANKIIIGQ
ncbi:hypothetical protein HYV12_00725 [Candidatus Dojkabacteria bacterium]|nr:hypothetical protein [Candidatus Dojkabacteria bacterium]